MTRTLLNQIAKSKKITLSDYTNVVARVNDAYTFVEVEFFNAMIYPGGYFQKCCSHKVRLSVASILKRDEWPDDYETLNKEYRGQWISDIK